MPKVGPRARRVAVIGAVVVVVGGGAAVAWATTRPAGASYRVAAAGPATVTDMLDGTGTIQPVSQATVTFPMSGQVQSVSVQLGQQVSVGQPLAQLNTTNLDDTVSSDQSAVASAQARLAADQASETSVSSSSGQQTTSPSSAGASGSGVSGQVAQLEHAVSADQNTVRQAQQKVDKDLQLVQAADHQVNAQGAACQALLNQLTSASQQPAKTTTPTDSSSSDTSPSSATTTPTDSSSVSDCEQLINAALADETTADNDEHTLSTAVATLSTDLNKVVAAVGQSASSGSSGSSGRGSSGTGSSGSASSGSRAAAGSGGSSAGGRSTGPASADQIAADQATVDAANAELAAAQQNLAAATLVSPIAGTVADLTVTAGQSASANSATSQVVIIGPGQDEVTTAVTDSQVGQVKPGDNASVTPDGATRPINGRVTQIGALGTTTSSGSASYPVTISLDSTSQQLFDGATASVGITLGTARAAVTVPTSAIHTIGGFTVVSKMVSGKPTLTRITTGVRGPTVTQVTSGLQPGDQVELADASQPMPTSTNGAGAGRIAGGGFGGGGGGAFRGGGGGAVRVGGGGG